LKKLFAIIVFAGLLIQTFSMVVLVTQFYVNQDFIAKNLCENRDKPQMHCNGKCCLKKQLARSGKEQAPGQRTQNSKQVINLFWHQSSFAVQQRYQVVTRQKYFTRNESGTFSFHHAVFHPPTV